MSHAVLQPLRKSFIAIHQDKETSLTMIEGLSVLLATTSVLYLKTMECYKHDASRQIISLPYMLEQQYKDLHQAGYIVAERIRSLGQQTFGTFREFLQKSAMKDDVFPPIEDTHAMIVNLIKGQEICGNEAKKIMFLAEKRYDDVTFDIAMSRITAHNKAVYMLKTLL